jgi:hypothetical protein
MKERWSHVRNDLGAYYATGTIVPECPELRQVLLHYAKCLLLINAKSAYTPHIAALLWTTMSTGTATLPPQVRDIIRPQFHQHNFTAEKFIKHELGLKLDKGAFINLTGAPSDQLADTSAL